jgi:hypothetical protein
LAFLPGASLQEPRACAARPADVRVEVRFVFADGNGQLHLTAAVHLAQSRSIQMEAGPSKRAEPASMDCILLRSQTGRQSTSHEA